MKQNREETVITDPTLYCIPYRLYPLLSQPQIEHITRSSNDIDSETYKAKPNVAECGRLLSGIYDIFKKAETLKARARKFFFDFVEQRFKKKPTWAYDRIDIYEKFGNTDPVIQHCSAKVLTILARLKADELDEIRPLIVTKKQLTVARAAAMVQLIINARAENIEGKRDTNIKTAKRKMAELDKKLNCTLDLIRTLAIETAQATSRLAILEHEGQQDA